jgi:hypothetical protein
MVTGEREREVLTAARKTNVPARITPVSRAKAQSRKESQERKRGGSSVLEEPLCA